ncbi:MAG: autorepressor SdpR family transcription factor [Gammaproteobacteria bacterium]
MSDQNVFKALSDPTRREILKQLTDGSKSAGELASRFDISRPSMSHHFNVLKAADLVRTHRDGQTIVYTLNATVLEDATRLLMDIFHVQDSQAPHSLETDHDAQ